MKTIRIFPFVGLIAAMGLFVSCGKDGKYPKNFPEGCPNFSEHAYAGDVLEAMAPGIYEFKISDGFGKSAVLAKSTDGWVYWLTDVDYIAADHSNFIGNVLYLGFYAVDNDKSSYLLYGETIHNYGKAQYYEQRDFVDRKAMIKGITTPAGEEEERFNYALKTADGVLDYAMALGHVAYHYSSSLFDSWGATFDTTICNIPVTCYIHDGHYFYVDDHWMCLYHVNKHLYNNYGGMVHELQHYYEAGDHEQTYAKIYELYGPSLPKPEWNTCVRSYRKQADEWLTDEYPRSLDGWFKVFNGNGTIHNMSIGRRATWNPLFDRIHNITVRIENVSYEDALAYKNDAETVCDEIYNDEYDPDAKTLYFKGSLEHMDIAGLDFGDHYFHPSYEITLNKEGTLVIVFDIINTMIV